MGAFAHLPFNGESYFPDVYILTIPYIPGSRNTKGYSKDKL